MLSVHVVTLNIDLDAQFGSIKGKSQLVSSISKKQGLYFVLGLGPVRPCEPISSKN